MTRGQQQEEVVKQLKEHKRVILNWATGVGKSRPAILAIQELKPKKALLLVAETAHKSNWRDEIEKFGGIDYLQTDLVVECYASLKNYADTDWDLLLCDEIHHVGSDLRLSILQTIKAKYILGLSATISKDLFYNLITIFGSFKLLKIGLQEAFDNNYLAEPTINLVPLSLDTQRFNQVYTKEWGTKAKRVTIECSYDERWFYMKNKIRYPHVTLNIHCTEMQKYNLISDEISYYERMFIRNRLPAFKNKWLRACLDRKIFLGCLKTDKVKTLIHQLNRQGKKFICFCTNINQADELGKANAIHSNKDNSLSIIDSFNSGDIQSIFAVGMLQEGQNLQGIEVGIIVQLDGKDRAFLQKTGRALRSKNPIQYIFYYKGTRDEEYLNKVTEGIDKSYFKTVTI